MKLPCLRCKKFPPDCTCPPLVVEPDPEPPAAAPPAEKRPEIVKLRREKRAGREVIVLEGVPADVDLEALARDIKRRCATGGTVKGATIEIQGDARDAIASILLERGLRSKRAGG
jgi:translation initiation factor 1